jgi:alpha-galactosidase
MPLHRQHLCCLLFLVGGAAALDNGLRVPPMGWSSWYGFTSNINETLFRETGDGLISSGLAAAGWTKVWISDGWAIGRDNTTGHVIEDPAVFPSGMKNLTDYLHGRGLSVGIYTSVGTLTCLGYSPAQPKRPGSCGFEQNDADVWVHEWGVDALFDDGCGPCPQHDPYAAMRDALNKTGKPVWYAIHAGTSPGSPNGTIANMWRTGQDLSSSTFAMWTSRLDTSTTPSQNALAGPGSFRDPDKLEVGYSPRAPKGRPNVMTAREQRAMFTMWAALPAPLILSADLRAASSGIDADALRTLTNLEVIAVNQDSAAQPMQLVSNTSGLQVWRKPLSGGPSAVVFFHRGTSTAGPLPDSAPQTMHVDLEALGFRPGAPVAVRDLWAKEDLGSVNVSFSASVAVREAKIYTFAQAPRPPPPSDVLPLTLFEPSTGAMCLDGSMGGYHARNGSKTQLMISLPVRRSPTVL